jgi:hypothetical protein
VPGHLARCLGDTSGCHEKRAGERRAVAAALVDRMKGFDFAVPLPTLWLMRGLEGFRSYVEPISKSSEEDKTGELDESEEILGD